MIKRFISLLLILPMLAYSCKQEETPQPDPDPKEQEDPKEKEDPQDPQEEEEDLYADAAPELKSGDVVQATNPIVEK